MPDDRAVTEPSERARRRRAEIAAAALSLFLQKGFHGTSVREIASAAGLSMGGLYEYISSKDDVLALVYQEMTSPFSETLAPDRDDDIVDVIAETLLESWRQTRDVQILYRETVHVDASHREELAEQERGHARRIAAVVEQGMERGELSCDDPLLMGHIVLFMAAFMPLRAWITRGDGIEASEDVARRVAHLLVSGLRT